MARNPKIKRLLACLAMLTLGGCALSAPPPERGNALLLNPSSAAVEGVSFELPSRRPSIEAGAAIYADKCLDCHGTTGRGDGPRADTVREQIGFPPADLTDPALSGSATAEQWFDVISAGRLDRLMPPFAGSLSVDQRWDVIAYVWSLSASQQSIEFGQAIYSERCAACHGESGRGDGPQAESVEIDFSRIASYQAAAAGQWQEALNVSHVPSFAGKLDSTERQAVVGYVRSFAYDQAASVSAPAPTPQPTLIAPPARESNAGGLIVQGALTNATDGGAIPSGAPVTLFVVKPGESAPGFADTAYTDAAGTFQFPDVDAQVGDTVSVAADYGEVRYVSQSATIEAAMPSVNLPITVYETATDVSALHVETLHLIVLPLEDRIQVDEIYVISNRSDRIVANTNGPAFRIGLPPGATGVQLLNDLPPEIVQIDPDGLAFFEAVFPGSGSVQLVLNYELSIDAGSVRLDRSALIPIDAVSLLVGATDSPLQLDSALFTQQNAREVNGVTFEQYDGAGLTPGQVLAVGLSRPYADFKLAAGMALLGVGVAVVGFGVWRRRGARRSTQPAKTAKLESTDDLIDRISALDDAFAVGEIEADAYRRLREKLKDRLVRQIDG